MLAINERVVSFDYAPSAALTFEQVYARTFPMVRSNARRLGVPRDVLDDVVQDVFLVMHRRLDCFLGECAVEIWVLGILHRVVKNYQRTWRRKGAGQALSSAVSDPATLSDPGHDTRQRVRRSEARRVLREVLDTLDERVAVVFVLAEVEGMSAPEIAEITQTNLSTVYSRCRAARRHFERALQQWLSQPTWLSLLE
jgi:RNA polymerase sigma-70 factor (ECF subfamily)